MLVIVFLGFVAVALSHGANDFTPLFDLFDVDNDGDIQLDEMFAGYNNDDKNKDGLITLEEFTAGSHPGSPPLSPEEAFKILDGGDRQEDDILDPTTALGPLKGMDENNDRKITLAEFDKNFVQLFGGTEDGDSKVQA